MGKNVLIATLGESPIVVTSMVKALREKADVSIDQVDVIYPNGGMRACGYDIVTEHLEGQGISVNPCELPFSDPNNRATSMEFLQNLSGLIQVHENTGNHVYLSLAGGRKNMSALMAVTCQFFGCIRGLYHILDKYEDSPKKRNFHTIEALWEFGEDERNKKLSPCADDLDLVEIPYPNPKLSNGVALRKYFSEIQADQKAATSIEIEGELDAFYREIFQKNKPSSLDIYLSKEAHEFYQQHRGEISKRLRSYFRSMQNSQALSHHNHLFRNANTQTNCTCFKKQGTDERLFYYQIDSKIIVATIVQHGQDYNRIINGERALYSRDHPPVIHSSELEGDSVMIAPLGKSPMVVTQTFALLSKREKANIKKVVVVHPKNSEIRNGAFLLKDVFEEQRDTACESVQINDIKDVTSDKDCKIYLKELVSVIQKVRDASPDKSIHLSLSGGRKGMAALTLFAAQHANIDAVYHTLITDIDLENQIEEETTLEALGKIDPQKKVRRLFLDAYDESKFELFRVPVVPNFHPNRSAGVSELGTFKSFSPHPCPIEGAPPCQPPHPPPATSSSASPASPRRSSPKPCTP